MAEDTKVLDALKTLAEAVKAEKEKPENPFDQRTKINLDAFKVSGDVLTPEELDNLIAAVDDARVNDEQKAKWFGVADRILKAVLAAGVLL